MNFRIHDGEKYRAKFERWADMDGAQVKVSTDISPYRATVELAFVNACGSARHYLTAEEAAAIASELLAASMVAAQAKKEAA